MPLADGLEATRDLYWNALNEDNRVSLLVKLIDVNTRVARLSIVNKYSS